MNNVKKELMAVSKSLKKLSDKTEKMLNTLDKMAEAPAVVKQKAKARPAKQKAKAKPAKKQAVKAKAKATAKTAAKPTAGEVILDLIKKDNKGVDTASIQETTGFNNQKVRDNIYKLQKRGKIRRVDRGVYIAV